MSRLLVAAFKSAYLQSGLGLRRNLHHGTPIVGCRQRKRRIRPTWAMTILELLWQLAENPEDTAT